jgi:hypothetical protein
MPPSRWRRSLFNFLLFRILPGDPAKLLVRDPRLGRQAQERIRCKFGLDKPVWSNTLGSTVEILSGSVDVLADPAEASQAVGQVAYRERLDYRGRSADGQWVSVVQFDDGGSVSTEGWVPADRVQPQLLPVAPGHEVACTRV